MPTAEVLVDPQRCGGTLWDKIDDKDWERYCQGHVVPYPWASMWCISPTRTAVAVQSGSLESLICVCANHGQKQRIKNLLASDRLDESDIHPAARADFFIYLRDRHALAQVLLSSPEARQYVCSLEPAHIDIDFVQWAQEFCVTVETRSTASVAGLNWTQGKESDG